MRHLSGTFKHAGRRLMAIWLACVVLSVGFPLDLVADSTPCRMACCVGAAPHSARKCSGGSCHANMERILGQTETRPAPARREVLCGLQPLAPERFTARRNAPALDLEDHPAHDAPAPRLIAAAVTLGQPCAVNCAPAGFNYTPSSKTATLAARSLAARPPPVAPASPLVARSETVSFQTPPGCGAATLRGPPVSRS